MEATVPEKEEAVPQSVELNKAKTIASASMTSLHTFFASAIRLVRSHQQECEKTKSKDQDRLWDACSFLVEISPTIKAVLYNAAQTFYPKELKKLDPLTPKSLTLLFHPLEISAFLGLIYLDRALKKNFEGASWKQIEEQTFTRMLTAHVVGQSMQHIHPGDAMFQAGLVSFAQSLLAISPELPAPPKARKERKTPGQPPSPEQRELSKYGCHRLHVAAALAQSLGYGSDVTICLTAPNVDHKEWSVSLKTQIAAWSAARVISNSYTSNKKQVELSEESELYISPADDKIVAEKIAALNEKEAPKCWIRAKADDLPAAVKAALCVDKKSSASLDEEIIKK